MPKLYFLVDLEGRPGFASWPFVLVLKIGHFGHTIFLVLMGFQGLPHSLEGRWVGSGRVGLPQGELSSFFFGVQCQEKFIERQN